MLKELLERYPELESCKDAIDTAREKMITSFENGNKLLVCGNGGSCADSEHIVGELMKGFLLRREIPQADRDAMKSLFPEDGDHLADNLQGALPAISLPSQSAILSAFINDVEPDMMYAQLVYGYASEKEVVIGRSTSGNS